MNETPVVLSGMRPTGSLHIGHVEGVLRNWVALQETHECNYFVADWHAITTDPNTEQIAEHTTEMVKDWIAAGIDPERSTLFMQSQIPEHAELSTVLSMLVNLGRLERLPTFTDYLKTLVEGEVEQRVYDEVKRAQVSHGFLGYPVLQSADILLYRTTTVPVGEDQLPHIELTRELAKKFNRLYGDVFIIPEALLGHAPRILGIDGKKMSKSLENAIDPTDTSETLEGKVLQLKTDPEKARRDDPGNPYLCSVYDLHELFSEDHKDVAAACQEGNIGCVDCKKSLGENIAETYAEFRERREEVTDAYVEEVLREGTKQARTAAEETMRNVKAAMGLFGA